MLIIIDESIIDAYTEDKLKFKYGLHNILDAHYSKKHFVYLTPKISNQIKKLNEEAWGEYLCKDTIAKLDSLSKQSVLNGQIKSSVGIHIEIYFNKISSPKTNVDPGIKNVAIWRYLITSDLEWLTNPTFIYGENIDDSTIFEYIAKSTAINKGLSSRNIKFRREMTGGCGNIKNIIVSRMNDAKDIKSACFFIADSDYKYPKNNIHSLRKESKANLQGYNNSAPMDLHILQSREIENLIPIELLLTSLEQKSKREKPIADALNAVHDFYNKYPDHYKYIDIKEGTCTKKINAEPACKNFFSSIDNATSQPCINKEHTKCFQVTPKVGDIVLSTLKEHIESHGERYLSKLKLHKNTEEWNQLSEIIFSISLCNEIQLT